MSESVKVVVKCRPMNQRETELRCESILQIDSTTRLCSIRNPNDKTAPAKAFTFDGTYTEEATNEQVYSDIAFPLVEAVTEGYNGTVFAYGQTGCGKTFSMQGMVDPPSQRGLIPRAFEQIFDTIAVAETTRYLIHASYLEIYNEDIRDLLGKDMKARLELKEKPDASVFVKDLSMHPCATVRDCEKVMTTGWSRRAVGATLMNASSSRSHSIFTIHLERCDVSEDGDNGRIRVSKLNLVDLAGSERQSKAGATGNRLKEATKINLSLSALGNVISALVDGRSMHIPYRDSKLTRLLQDSLGGNTKTLMVACLSPADNNYEETLSTLRYAKRAKNIRNKPTINEDPKDAIIREYLDEIARLKTMLETTGQQQSLEPKIIERIVHVRNEDEIKEKANAIAREYEQKMKMMAEELAEANANRDKATFEIQRMQAEAEEEKRRLREQHERNEKEMNNKLESMRKGKDALTNEMNKLREKYQEELKKVDQSVSPDQVEVEKKRIRESYEEEVKKMKEELDLVKQNKDLIQKQMENLQESYAEELRKASIAIQPEQLELEKKKMQKEFESQMLRMKADLEQLKSAKEKVAFEMAHLQRQYHENIAKAQDSVPKEQIEAERKRIKESYEKDIGALKKELEEVKLIREQLMEKTNTLQVEHAQNLSVMAMMMSAEQVEQEKKQLEEEYLARTKELEKEIEALKQSKEEAAMEIALIKSRYQEAIRNAENDPAIKDFAQEKKNIKTKFELLMDRVRDDLDGLKLTKNFITKELGQKKIIKEDFDAKMARLNSQELTPEQLAVEEAGLLKLFKEDMLVIDESLAMQRSDLENVRAKEKYDKEKTRLEESVRKGSLTQDQALQVMAELNHDLIRCTEPTRTSEAVIIEDLETSSDPEVSMTQETHQELASVKDWKAGVASSRNLLQVKRVTEEGSVAPRSPLPPESLPTSHEAEQRLRELQEQMVGGCSSNDDQRRNAATTKDVIIEKLRKEKMHAEMRKRQIEQADEAGAVIPLEEMEKAIFKDAQEEIAAKNKALNQLRALNETLKREVHDIQGEFEIDRMDYLETIRKQEQGLLWYQTVVEKVLPAIRRDANYVNLEKIRAQSEWDDINHRWNLPKFTVDKLILPSPAGGGISRQITETQGHHPGADTTSQPDNEAWLSYELRSEDRFIKRLNETTKRDPAATYFKQSRGEKGLMMQVSSASDRRLVKDFKTSPSKPASSRELRTVSPNARSVIQKMQTWVTSTTLEPGAVPGFRPSSPRRQF